jgi:BirA family biotin operon repressor/biotin-[acetyl-CoA-carboxylase] ligase
VKLSGPSGWRLQVYDVLPSTSDWCRDLAVAGEPAGLAVLARRQTHGRGSRGRDWQSPSGNLFLSVLLRPDDRARSAAQWSLLAAVALLEALFPFLPDASVLRLKWPNDVMLHGRKLAGILVDSSAGTAGLLDWLVIGIGVNLAVAPVVAGRDLACLADVADAPVPEAFASFLLARLGYWQRVRALEGFQPVRSAWLAHTAAPGTPISLRLGSRVVEGMFSGLGDDGSLRLLRDGRVETFATGEVLQGEFVATESI